MLEHHLACRHSQHSDAQARAEDAACDGEQRGQERLRPSEIEHARADAGAGSDHQRCGREHKLPPRFLTIECAGDVRDVAPRAFRLEAERG